MAASAATVGPPAHAGMTYDLRFSDGSHQQDAALGAYSLELWARVSGTDGNVTNEAHTFDYLTILSTQSGGGAITSGGLFAGTLSSGFDEPGSRPGSGSDLNADGITDWGSTSTAGANTNYMLARTAVIGGRVGGGSIGQSVNANTWEYKIASFTLSIGSLGVGTTTFNVVKPNAKATVGAFTYSASFVDGTNFNVNTSNQQGAYAGSLGITIGLSPPPPPPPANITWDGGATGAGTQWLDSTNWSVDTATSTEHVPGPFDAARFGALGSATTIGIDMGGATNNGAAKQAVGMISLQSDANRDITIENSSASTDGTLTIAGVGGVSLSNESAIRTLTIRNGAAGRNLDVRLDSSGINVTNTGASIVISSRLIGIGSLVKTGLGLLQLDGANTYTGTTSVAAGKVSLTAGGSFASPTVSVSSGATLAAAGSLAAATALSNNGQVQLTSTSQQLQSLNGTGSLSLNPTALSVDSGSYSGQITGSGSLTKASGGVLTLTGANSYTGGTTVSGGELVGNTSSLVGNIVNNGAVSFDQGNPGTYAGSISGSGIVNLKQTGTFVYITAPSNYSGATNILAGQLLARATNILSTSSMYNVNGSLVLDGPYDQTIGGMASPGPANTAGVQLGGSTGATPTLTVGGNNLSSTFAGTVSRGGNLVKVGAGELTLSGNNAYTGSTTVNGGRLVLVGPVGSTNLRAASGGTLRLTGTINGVTARADSGGTVEEFNANVTGSTLRGPGTHLMLGTSNTFTNVTALNGTLMQQNVSTTLSNFTSAGQMTNNAALTWDGGSMGPSGALIVNNTANLKAFDSSGVITVNSGGTVNNSESSLALGGGSRTTVNSGGNVNLLGGVSMDVSGGLVVNNGVITGDINAYYGSTIKGSGTFNGAVNLFDGAKFSPGNSPGSATVGSITFGSGGSYLFEVSDATAAPGVGSDYLSVINSLAITSDVTTNSKFLVSVASLDLGGGPGPADHFDPTQEYHWTLVHAAGGITGFAPQKFAIDRSAFVNPTGAGTFNITQSSNDLVLNFTPVPEPVVLWLASIAMLGMRRRRRGRCEAFSRCEAAWPAL